MLVGLSVTPMNEKRSEWPCTVVKAIIYCFDSYLATSLTKFDAVLLLSRPTCGGRWLKSILFLYRSDGISVAVLGSS